MANSTSARTRALPTTRGTARQRLRVSGLNGELILVGLLVLVSLVAQGLNMFHYPAFTFTEDEGIYAAQAWAVLRMGQLSPYTYFYDHAPAGWLLLAGWMGLTGGPDTFGSVIDSGRILMLLLHVAMAPLLFRVARKLGCEVPTAALAVLLFSLSPLAIFYQRMVLLDSIMMFWILLSLDLLLNGWGQLSRVVLSGVCFGLAALTKETAVFLVPAMLYIAWHQRWRHQGRFAFAGWLLPVAIVVSWYPLFALLKGEFFPAAQGAQFGISGYASSNVSLLDSLRWQMSRSGGGMFNLDNHFWQLVRADWMVRDPLLLAGGALATLINLLRGFRDRRMMAIGLLGLTPLLYLARGGIVFNFYILLAIPFLALNLAAALNPLVARLPRRVAPAFAAACAAALVAGYWMAGTLQPLFSERPDQAGREALAWIKQNLPADSRVVTRDDLWADLHEAGPAGPVFPDAHSHYKVAGDPAIKGGVFQNDWRRVDYLIMTPDMQADFQSSNNTVALEAFQNANLVKSWDAPSSNTRLHPGQVVELWKVDKPGTTEAALLAESNVAISRRFEQNGAFVDRDGSVTSEAQSYAMLRAVWSDDRATFDRAWAWTQANLINEEGLLAWQWRDGEVVDPNTATDGDTDTALALLLAGRRWNAPELQAAGVRMVQAVWEREVADVGGEPYITAGNWAKDGTVVALNPSYFSPYAYRIFQEVDPDNNWTGVIETGYRVLFESSRLPLGAARSAGLPPDWVGLQRETGEFVPLEINKGNTTQYGFDAGRTYWRVALDLRWSGDGRADSYLRQAGFLLNEVNQILDGDETRKGFVSGVYEHDGSVVQVAPSMVSTAGAVAALLTLDPATGHMLHTSQLVGGAMRDQQGVYWGDPTDLYGNEWAWFSTALYADALPNLWQQR